MKSVPIRPTVVFKIEGSDKALHSVLFAHTLRLLMGTEKHLTVVTAFRSFSDCSTESKSLSFKVVLSGERGYQSAGCRQRYIAVSRALESALSSTVSIV